MSKTNTGLVAYAKAQLGKPYWYGCFGQVSTTALYSSKKRQYPTQYQWSCPKNQLNVRVHDCIGLIKGYLWSDTASSTPKYNASQDVSANGMLEKCTSKGPISSMPDVPGILVFLPGHVGVYIGDGYVIEAKGHAYGVVKTRLAGRGWKSWGKCPWITYENVTKPTVKPSGNNNATTTNQPKYKVGSTYTLNVDLNVRKGAGTRFAQKKRSEITSDGRKHAVGQTMATLRKGTKVTVKSIKTENGNIWLEIPSGWVAAYYNKKTYIS